MKQPIVLGLLVLAFSGNLAASEIRYQRALERAIHWCVEIHQPGRMEFAGGEEWLRMHEQRVHASSALWSKAGRAYLAQLDFSKRSTVEQECLFQIKGEAKRGRVG